MYDEIRGRIENSRRQMKSIARYMVTLGSIAVGMYSLAVGMAAMSRDWLSAGVFLVLAQVMTHQTWHAYHDIYRRMK